VFGPVTSLYRFGPLEDAIARANAVRYGLSASVFTSSLEIAERCVDLARAITGAGLADLRTAAVLAAAGLAACFLAGLAALDDFLVKTGLLTTALLSYVPYNRGSDVGNAAPYSWGDRKYRWASRQASSLPSAPRRWSARSRSGSHSARARKSAAARRKRASVSSSGKDSDPGLDAALRRVSKSAIPRRMKWFKTGVFSRLEPEAARFKSS